MQVDRKIEEIGNERNFAGVARQSARLQNVDAFEDQNVRPVDDHRFVGNHIVGQVRIDRRLDARLPGP